MTNPNRPVYRYPPRSHAYSCRCPRCEPFKSRPSSSGAWIWVAIPAVAGLCWIALAPLRIWHTVGRDGQMHPDTATYIAYGIPVGVIFLLMVFASIRATGKQRPPKGRLRAEATTVSQLKPPPPSVCVPRPACRHLHALKVPDVYGETVAYLCPDPPRGCGMQLGAEFGRYRRFCCGTEPGDPHWHSCPQAQA